MNPRSLPMLNAIGCLILAAVVFTQWGKESRVEADMSKLRVEAAFFRTQAEAGTKHAADLERDITVLKQSLEATQRAAIQAADSIKHQENFESIGKELSEARGQVENWKTSIAERDARFRNLNAELTLTRQRLDEAYARLRAAGAR